MNYQIQSIHFSVDKMLKSFIRKKIDKLINIHTNIISTEIFLKFENNGSYNNKVVEIKLNAPLTEFFAKKQSDSFEESVDLASQALRKQILRNK